LYATKSLQRGEAGASRAAHSHKSRCDPLYTLFVDFEDYRLTDFKAIDTDALLAAFQQVAGKPPAFLFFDEVQQLSDWSRVLRTLHNQNRYRIAVSGSNSRLLEREISTELRGRCRNILIFPFSFPEILRYGGIPYDETTLLTPARARAGHDGL
jgi:hypothetical protein